MAAVVQRGVDTCRGERMTVVLKVGRSVGLEIEGSRRVWPAESIWDGRDVFV